MKRTSLVAVIISFAVVHAAWASHTYQIDPSHASVGFTIDHFVISKVRGNFREFDGKIVLGEEGKIEKADSTIEVDSIDTGIEGRDKHLKSADFFDAATYPQITFLTKNVKRDGGKDIIVGDLTMHGVTKEVELPCTIKGPVKDPYGKTRIGFEAKATINRADYGLTWNKVMEAGGVAVGENVEIEINLEAIEM